jgi:hypothetical protein
MKLTNTQVITLLNGFSELQNKKLPVKVGFAITKNMKVMESSASAYESERSKIVGKYAKKDENGNPVVNNGRYVFGNQKDQDGYTQEVNELLEIENDVDIQTVTLDDLERCDDDKYDQLSVHDLTILEIMTE